MLTFIGGFVCGIAATLIVAAAVVVYGILAFFGRSWKGFELW